MPRQGAAIQKSVSLPKPDVRHGYYTIVYVLKQMLKYILHFMCSCFENLFTEPKPTNTAADQLKIRYFGVIIGKRIINSDARSEHERLDRNSF